MHRAEKGSLGAALQGREISISTSNLTFNSDFTMSRANGVPGSRLPSEDGGKLPPEFHFYLMPLHFAD